MVGSLSPQRAAELLVRERPEHAPLTWTVLAEHLDLPDARSARRYADDRGLAIDQRFASLERLRSALRDEGRELRDPTNLVAQSMHDLLQGRRAPSWRPARADLEIRPARRGDMWRSWSYGSGGSRSHVLSGFEELHVLNAYEGRRLVGSLAFKLTHAQGASFRDLDEISGVMSFGPFFRRTHGWTIIVDSVWVARDRRRDGIARALISQLKGLNLPAWATFRDPWFAAGCYAAFAAPDQVGECAWAEATAALQRSPGAKRSLAIDVRLDVATCPYVGLAAGDARQLAATLLGDDPEREMHEGRWSSLPLNARLEGDLLIGRVQVDCDPRDLERHLPLLRRITTPFEVDRKVDDPLREFVAARARSRFARLVDFAAAAV